ncbi:WxL domain-containing protein [Enterococcus durans]|uniref:WxL domain-containing protein n=1 Tax=Enterococcus durans TaxID=53345 RepID=UPI001883F9B1|nr:WxL domain-containing protein [Enterococcus durans]MBE9887160.1 WxL domain-containing protein [Enterococcus durans]
MKNRSFTLTLLLGLSLFSSQLVFADSQTEGKVAYTQGALEFDYDSGIPVNLNFGDHPLQTVDAENWIATETGAQTGSTSTTGTVAIRDNRGNDEATWTVKLSQTEQFTANGTELSGAALNLSFGGVTNNLNLQPTSSYANGNLEILTFGQDYTILDATAGNNSGDSALTINEFSLDVPANTKKVAGTYTATLNWTFSSTPGI